MRQTLESSSAGLRVCVLTANDLLGEAFRALLAKHGYRVVSDAAEADVTLVDLLDPTDSELGDVGERAIALMRGNDDPVPLLHSGFRGYIRMHALIAELKRALTAVHNGEVWAERRTLERLAFGTPGSSTSPTRREAEVLRHLAEGRSNREIAARLGIAEATVKAHITSLFEKFSVSSRLELVVKQRELSTDQS